MSELEKIIVSIVSSEQGIKELALIVKVINEYHFREINTLPSDEDIMAAFNNLVERNDLVAVNYVLPLHTNKLKTIYFPKGTKFL